MGQAGEGEKGAIAGAREIPGQVTFTPELDAEDLR